MIGFTCTDINRIDELFDRFLYSIRTDISTRGNHSCTLKDGTVIKKIYNIENMSKYYIFDQLILGGQITFSRIKEPIYRKQIRWNENVPEEFRVQYWNNYAD